MNVNEANQEMVKYIANHITKNLGSTQQSTTWDQVLAQSARLGNPVGEIRVGDDLAKVPRGKKLKVVYMPNDTKGPVIRWGDSSSPNTKTVLAAKGTNHDYFHRVGDNVSGAKQGYLTVASNGTLSFK